LRASKPSPLDSHEIIEAAIDTIVQFGRIDRSQSPVDQLKTREAADVCQGRSTRGRVPTAPVRLINGILVVPYWSNADNACEPITHTVHLDDKGQPATVPHQALFDGSSSVQNHRRRRRHAQL